MRCMPRYVILLHELPEGHERARHWDLMLEQEGALRTWALDGEPSADLSCDAQELPDHRLAYLDYEGPVSDDRGHVTRSDRGQYRVVDGAADRLVVDLLGEKLQARVTLERRRDHFWRVSFSAEPTSG
jgi:hypothetical protein